MYTASKWTQQQEYHFSFYEILVSKALAMQIGLILKNSCKGNKLTKYSKKTYKWTIFWHRVPNIVWGEKKKFRRQRKKKRNQICRVPYKDTRQSSDFAVCHREVTAKLIFAVCQQLGTRQKIILPCVFSSHSGKTQFAVCLIFTVSFFIWHSVKTLFSVCPWCCSRQRARNTANREFPVVERPLHDSMRSCLLLFPSRCNLHIDQNHMIRFQMSVSFHFNMNKVQLL